MDRFKSLEIDSIECAVIIGNEIRTYAPKRKEFLALEYDGSIRMAIAIEESCSKSWIEWDEENNFCGLRAFSSPDYNYDSSEYVDKGDYLQKTNDGFYLLIRKVEFKSMFERVID